MQRFFTKIKKIALCTVALSLVVVAGALDNRGRTMGSNLLYATDTTAESQTEIDSATLAVADSIISATYDSTLIADSLTTIDDDTIACDYSVSWGQRVANSLDLLVSSPGYDHMQTSIMVWDLASDTLIYQYKPRQQMRPASNAKLLVAIAALDALTDSYCLKTRLYYRGSIDSTVLRGDICIRAGFDPLFDAHDMHNFISAIKATGIDSISGHLYVDVSMKDTLKWGKGWSWDDDEAVLSPLLYEGRDVFMNKFMAELDQAGIKHPATYSRTILEPKGLVKVAESSHSVRQLLPQILKPSNNLYGEALFHQLGADTHHPYADSDRSAHVVEAFIRDSLHLNPADYTITDGCGLSHYNSYSCQLMIEALRFAWTHEQVKDALYDALPIAGVDGTLKSRMIGTRAQRNVHAKTGTLTHVSTLSGFATSAQGVPLAFAIFNSGNRSSSEGRGFQDKVCILLTR